MTDAASASPSASSDLVALPSLTVPSGGGSVKSIGETFTANPVTGTASLTVPIWTSPGRNGADLGLTLAYDSGAGNGPFGLGWQLSPPSISRKTEGGLPRYRDARDETDGSEDAEENDDGTQGDVFVLTGFEDLVPLRNGRRIVEHDRGEHRVRRYRPRTEGAFSRIDRWTHLATGDVHWRATSRDNVTSIFGRSTGARIVDPSDPRRVASWLVEETHDDRGNVVRYEYKEENASGIDPGRSSESNRFDEREGRLVFRAVAQRYLKRIHYGNARPFEGSPFLFEVVFDYGEHDPAAPAPCEARPWPVRRDPFSSYRYGFEVRTYRLCRRVLVFHRLEELGPEPVLVRLHTGASRSAPIRSLP